MLGIVILNYKTWEETIKCVDSILKTTNLAIKIYIVDNASPNDSFERLNIIYSDKDNITCIKAEENGGFAKGNNIGIQACLKDNILYAIITNNDVIFKENCINHMYEVMKTQINVVQIGPKVIDNEGKLLSPAWSGRQSLLQYLHIVSRKKIIMTEAELIGVKKVYMISGCCFMIDIAKFIHMGGFDENTFFYNEESIISMQAVKAGYDILCDMDAVVIHNHGASTEKKTLFTDVEVLKSGMYYWKKYENISNAKLIFLFVFMFFRMNIKIILRKTKSTGYTKYMREIWEALLYTLKQ